MSIAGYRQVFLGDVDMPTWLRGMTAVAVARLGRDGSLIDANQGFRALLPSPATTQSDVRDAFVNPRFDQFAGRRARQRGAAVYSGILNLGNSGAEVASLQGAIYDIGEELLLVAEHDIAGMAAAMDKLKALNAQLAQERPAASQAQRLHIASQLTQRELEVLERLMTGQSNKQVAADLRISPRTVETHRANIMAKMQAKNVIHLLRQILIGAD